MKVTIKASEFESLEGTSLEGTVQVGVIRELPEPTQVYFSEDLMSLSEFQDYDILSHVEAEIEMMGTETRHSYGQVGSSENFRNDNWHGQLRNDRAVMGWQSYQMPTAKVVSFIAYYKDGESLTSEEVAEVNQSEREERRKDEFESKINHALKAWSILPNSTVQVFAAPAKRRGSDVFVGEFSQNQIATQLREYLESIDPDQCSDPNPAGCFYALKVDGAMLYQSVLSINYSSKL